MPIILDAPKTQYTQAEKRQLVLWELHKEVHGFRPRHYTAEEWADESFVEARIKELDTIYETR